MTAKPAIATPDEYAILTTDGQQDIHSGEEEQIWYNQPEIRASNLGSLLLNEERTYGLKPDVA